jgi:hypothetical protein
MQDGVLLRSIRESPWLAQLLARFDFDIEGIEHGPVEPVHLASGEALEMVGRDASGGAFMLAGPDADQRPVVYIGSEGEGGLIARSVQEAIALIVGLPSLHDATRYPYAVDGGRRLRAWIASCDDDVREDWPELDADRARVRDMLDLPASDGLLEAFHAALADDRYRPVSDHGETYTSMLG